MKLNVRLKRHWVKELAQHSQANTVKSVKDVS